MSTVHLCTGLLERDGRVLLAASHYPNQPQPLWNLPGGRRREGELLEETLRREFREEAALDIEVGELLYVSESHDRSTGMHFLNITFAVSAQGQPHEVAGDAHVVGLAWVPRGELAARVSVRIVREPLLAALAGDERRYFGFDDAGITIEFAEPA
ncbi:MAG: NUDIX hydrolase [Candidatus Baltobacteraceae bacterium]|jgi:ADP-ribose pyrophosphatase YjhB (NUDIX family)